MRSSLALAHACYAMMMMMTTTMMMVVVVAMMTMMVTIGCAPRDDCQASGPLFGRSAAQPKSGQQGGPLVFSSSPFLAAQRPRSFKKGLGSPNPDNREDIFYFPAPALQLYIAIINTWMHYDITLPAL